MILDPNENREKYPFFKVFYTKSPFKKHEHVAYVQEK